MRTRQLGKTDLHVSRIAFGCWRLSPAFWGEVPLRPWEDAVRAALDCGVNFIDTADAYGLTLAQLAVRWVLAHPALTTAIVGVKERTHIEGIAAAADADLPHDDWHRVARALAEANR